MILLGKGMEFVSRRISPTAAIKEWHLIIRATRRNIPEDGILHSHSYENLKSYIALTGLAL
jgi:hypothetical protein